MGGHVPARAGIAHSAAAAPARQSRRAMGRPPRRAAGAGAHHRNDGEHRRDERGRERGADARRREEITAVIRLIQLVEARLAAARGGQAAGAGGVGPAELEALQRKLLRALVALRARLAVPSPEAEDFFAARAESPGQEHPPPGPRLGGLLRRRGERGLPPEPPPQAPRAGGDLA